MRGPRLPDRLFAEIWIWGIIAGLGLRDDIPDWGQAAGSLAGTSPGGGTYRPEGSGTLRDCRAECAT